MKNYDLKMRERYEQKEYYPDKYGETRVDRMNNRKQEKYKKLMRKTMLKDISDTVVFSVNELQNNSEIRGANKVIGRIKSAPTADVQEVKHGKWTKNYNGRDCSECGFRYYANGGLFNYCPNCGAKMDK